MRRPGNNTHKVELPLDERAQAGARNVAIMAGDLFHTPIAELVKREPTDWVDVLGVAEFQLRALELQDDDDDAEFDIE